MNADLNGLSSALRGVKYTSEGFASRVLFSVLIGMNAADDNRSRDPATARPSCVAKYLHNQHVRAGIIDKLAYFEDFSRSDQVVRGRGKHCLYQLIHWRVRLDTELGGILAVDDFFLRDCETENGASRIGEDLALDLIV